MTQDTQTKTTHFLRFQQIRSKLGLFGVVQFLILSTLAMMYYPGGTPWDSKTTGYTFWHNALSDLGRTIAYNEQENPIASPLFNSALFLLGLSTFILFLSFLKVDHFQDSRFKNGLFCGLGASSSLGLMVVGLTPDNLFPHPHILGVWLWGFCLLFQTLFILLNLFKSDLLLPPQWLTALLFLSIATLLTMGILNMWSPWVTSAQKVVVYLNIAWYMGFTRNNAL